MLATVLLALVAVAAAQQTTISGEYRQVADDFDFIVPRRLHYVLTDAGEEIELNFGPELPDVARVPPFNGERVMITGHALPSKGLQKRFFVSGMNRQDGDRHRRTFTYDGINGMTKGTRDVILILLSFSDGYQMTQTDADNAVAGMWTGTNAAKDNSCAHRFDRCSNGQMQWPQTIPVYFATIPTSVTDFTTNGCAGYNTWATQGWNAISSQASVTSKTNFVYVMPKEAISGCSIGRGHLCLNGCTTSISSGFPKVWMRYDYIARFDTYAHELGHNIGLHHSGVRGGNEYADTSDTMGYASTAIKCFNSPHMLFMGWVGQPVEFDPQTQGTATFQIQALSDSHKNGSPAGNPYAVRVTRADSTSEHFYVEYRPNQNADSGIPSTFSNKVGVVSAASSNAITNREANLLAGDTFDSTTGDVRITVLSIANNVATVSIGPITPQCTVDADCADGNPCNGDETCVSQVCQPGTNLDCSDAFACTTDSCNPSSGCVHTPNDAACGDGNACTLDSCSASSGCINTFIAGCQCNLDGVCDIGEDCATCSDCESGTFGGSQCGNGVCEAGDGEDCYSCPSDCNGITGGKPSGRYCCGGDPSPCGDSRCGSSCTTQPANPSSYCCGDGLCSGPETQSSCFLDCEGVTPPPPPPPTTTTTTTQGPCLAIGQSCANNADCCSNDCKKGKQVCQ